MFSSPLKRSVLHRIQNFDLNSSDVIRKFRKMSERPRFTSASHSTDMTHLRVIIIMNVMSLISLRTLFQSKLLRSSSLVMFPHIKRGDGPPPKSKLSVWAFLFCSPEIKRSEFAYNRLFTARTLPRPHERKRALENPCQHLQTFESWSCVAAQRWHPSSRAAACVLVLLVSREDFCNIRAIFSSSWSILRISLVRITITSSLIYMKDNRLMI